MLLMIFRVTKNCKSYVHCNNTVMLYRFHLMSLLKSTFNECNRLGYMSFSIACLSLLTVTV